MENNFDSNSNYVMEYTWCDQFWCVCVWCNDVWITTEKYAWGVWDWRALYAATRGYSSQPRICSSATCDPQLQWSTTRDDDQLGCPSLVQLPLRLQQPLNEATMVPPMLSWSSLRFDIFSFVRFSFIRFRKFSSSVSSKFQLSVNLSGTLALAHVVRFLTSLAHIAHLPIQATTWSGIGLDQTVSTMTWRRCRSPSVCKLHQPLIYISTIHWSVTWKGWALWAST